MSKTLLLLLISVVMLLGCTGFSANTIIPAPEDEFLYQTSITHANGATYPTSFSVLEDPVQIGRFCSGCVGGYYLKFWYVPQQVDSFTGDIMAEGRTIDTATLTKPLYHNEAKSINYLDNIYSISCYSSKADRDYARNKLDLDITIVGYNPVTRELTLDGFPQGQTWFTIVYFHSLNGKFAISYKPNHDPSYGFVSDDRAIDWVKIAKQEATQIVEPFTIRFVPIMLGIPKEVEMSAEYKFEFWIHIETTTFDINNIEYATGIDQRWQVSCK